MDRLTAKDFAPELLELYDYYGKVPALPGLGLKTPCDQLDIDNVHN